MAETLRLVDFKSEMAGRRVGWVSLDNVRDRENNETPLVSVNVVTATVGQEGAWYGHTIDKRFFSPEPEQQGFLAVAAFSAILTSPTDSPWEEEFNLIYLSQANRDAIQLLDKGVDRGVYGGTGDPTSDWATNPAELLDQLKEKLSDVGFKERYAQLYYWLNGAIARPKMGYELTPKEFESMKIDELLLPDQTMKTTTKEQLAHARSIVDQLGQSAKSDETMRKRLTVFSDIPVTDVPDTFVENRHLVAKGEKEIGKHVSKLAVRQLVYLPIGNRSGGRTWPYMDASATDEDVAFGRELNGLRRGSIEPANRELGREIDELVMRQQYAQQGVRRFSEISHAEAAL